MLQLNGPHSVDRMTNLIIMLQLNRFPSVDRVTKIVSEYDQEIPQSQTADNPMAPRGRATQPSRDNKHKVNNNRT